MGERLGVSRTALYRHFSDKQALLAAVGREGFRMLRAALTEAWERHGRGRAGFEAMGIAYVDFAVAHPSHYRVMFGGFVESCAKDAGLHRRSDGGVRRAGRLARRAAAGRPGPPRRPELMARFIWSVVHGIAMLAIDGQLGGEDTPREALTHYATGRLRAAIAAA